MRRKCRLFVMWHRPANTMAPAGSEFSRCVWISIFTFYFLAQYLRSFTGSYCIVLMYVYIISISNTASTSNWKGVAGVITQWFWCKYFAHNFILHSEYSKKNYRLPILYYNTAEYPYQVTGAVCLCLGGRKEIVTTPLWFRLRQKHMMLSQRTYLGGAIVLYCDRRSLCIWVAGGPVMSKSIQADE